MKGMDMKRVNVKSEQVESECEESEWVELTLGNRGPQLAKKLIYNWCL